jgi:ribosomal-protein-alanine N-acetyltransferase
LARSFGQEQEKEQEQVMGIALRGYRAEDLDAMYELDVACFERPFRFSRATMRSFAEAGNARAVLAVDGAKVAGFGILQVEPLNHHWAGYIVTLDVDPAYRRQRLGRRLMAALEGHALAAGCTELVLHVFSGNEAAIRFYEGCGFMRATRAEGFYGRSLGGRSLDAWVYCKPIEAS